MFEAYNITKEIGAIGAISLIIEVLTKYNTQTFQISVHKGEIFSFYPWGFELGT